jgi:hypothetical protein
MLLRIWNRLISDINPRKVLLGRWGYHWEINKNIQKYYE